MELRRYMEQREHAVLSPNASFADRSLGRQRPEEECSSRTCFARDIDRIIHSKAFRRLTHKTQVFLSPEGDHYRTRLTHTLEVNRISRTISRALGLNEDLTEAIALGHDLGHTPFGHAGERLLNEVLPEGFSHNGQSLRVVDKLEKNGTGLNLTREVRDGIVNHTGPVLPFTMEGMVVRVSDRIAYINHDIDDAVRGGIITYDDIPSHLNDYLGRSYSQKIDSMVHAVIEYSLEKNEIGACEKMTAAMDEMRRFMFENVYTNPVAKGEESKAQEIIRQMYHYYLTHPELMGGEYSDIMRTDGVDRAVADYIAGMTDRYLIAKYTELFVPGSWKY